MDRVDEADYHTFVAARMEALRRTAYLLCRDWHTADDLVSITIGKLYRHWAKVNRAGNVEAYVRGVLTNAWLDERRRPWRREQPAPEPIDVVDAQPSSVEDRLSLLALLERLGPKRRAVVVLRFYCDLSVEETAQILGISEGTVKSQAARGLETLRLLVPDEVTRGRK